MRQRFGTSKAPAEQVVKDIRRTTRKHYSAEDKIRVVAYFGRAAHIIKQRERIKRKTIEHRRLQHRKIAA